MLLKGHGDAPGAPELIRELQWVTARSRSALTLRRHAPLARTRVADDALGDIPRAGSIKQTVVGGSFCPHQSSHVPVVTVETGRHTSQRVSLLTQGKNANLKTWRPPGVVVS